MIPAGFITLTTDFGVGSSYVAAMKGVILSICPSARIIDLCHSIEPQNINAGSIILEDIATLYPPGTIHIVVVDPGVGTNREIILTQIGDYYYIAPNNGILSRVVKHAEEQQEELVFYSLSKPLYWRQETISNTFHGRDIMAPVAAQLLCGVKLPELGIRIPKIVQLEIPKTQKTDSSIMGVIEYTDSFGNLITNIRSSDLEGRELDDSAVSVLLSGCFLTKGLNQTYADKSVGACTVLIGSSNRLEIAIVNGNAAQTFKANIGDEVKLIWEQKSI